MQMEPQYYFNNFVKPNYSEFCDDKGSIRKAFNAVVSLFHMTDNYFNYYKRKGDSRVSGFNEFKDFKIYMANKTHYFNDIQSIANAYKHLYTNSGKVHVTVESSGAVYVEDVDETSEIVDGNDLEHSFCNAVYYLKKDGTSVQVKDAMREMIKVWENIL